MPKRHDFSEIYLTTWAKHVLPVTYITYGTHFLTSMVT